MDLAFWRDLSVIWLSLFCFIGLALPLAILYFLVRGLHTLHENSAKLLQRTQAISQRASAQSEQMATQVREPFVSLQKRTKRLETFFQSLFD